MTKKRIKNTSLVSYCSLPSTMLCNATPLTVDSNNNTNGFNTNATNLEECWESNTLVYLNLGVGIFNTFIVVFGICSNIFVCCVVCKNRLWRSSDQFVLIFFLAVADLLTSSIIVPIEAISFYTYNHDKYFLTPSWTVFQNALWFSQMTLSLCMVLLLTVDRFIGVRFPLERLTISTRKVLIAVGGVWIYALLVFLFYFFMQTKPAENYYQFIMPGWAQRIGFYVTVFIPLNINTILYLYIFHFVRATAKERTKITSVHRKQKCNIKLYFCVVAVYLLLWQPYCMYEVYILNYPEAYATCEGESIDSLLSSLIHANTVCNAFIYSATSSTFKTEFKNLRRVCFSREKLNVSESSKKHSTISIISKSS